MNQPITKEDKEALISGLSSGLGFTKSCNLILHHPQIVSTYLRKNPKVMRECKIALSEAGKAMMQISSALLKEKKYEEWKKSQKDTKAFITEIRLWESLVKNKEATPRIVAEAFLFCGCDTDETATSIGMTRLELQRYMMNNKAVTQMIAILEKNIK